MGWPTSQEISNDYWTRVEDSTIKVTADGIWCDNIKLEVLNLNIEANKNNSLDFSLEVTGIIDNSGYEEYKTAAGDVMVWLYEEENLEKVEEVIHPYIKESNMQIWQDKKQELQVELSEYEFGSKLNVGIKNVYNDLSPEIQETLKDNICDTEELIRIVYEIEYIQNGYAEYRQCTFYMARKGEQIQVFHFGNLHC